jgi:3-hydroxyacyl-CoA dehydrogenase
MEVTDTKVKLSMEHGIAVLRIDNPPVNASSSMVRAGLLQALEEAREQKATGAILIGAGKTFVSGSDLKEFDLPLAPPELPDVIRAIEDASFPVVAALHGVALGGGFELALGCDYRLARSGTKLGLPEVSLGFVPGAGGTQRLPRLVGRSRAIDMICGSRQVEAQKALDIGLIDEIADGDLIAAAMNLLNRVGAAKRRVIDIAVPQEPDEAVDSAVAQALKRGRGRPNIEEAIRLVRLCGTTASPEALADERGVFQRLRVAPDAFALRYLFFSERRSGAVEGIDASLARKIERIGIVGGGTMGQGIARAALGAGFQVLLAERDQALSDAAITKIRTSLDTLVAKGLLSVEAASGRASRLRGVIGAAALVDCDLVIEAVFEDMDVKRQVIAELEAELGPDTIIATNTSYLDINAMTEGSMHPERMLGLHFFSPADVMPLLEIVRAECTSKAALATGLGLAKKLRKQPVVARVAEGFIGNRIYNAYRRRAELLVLDGATPEAVDSAACDFGFAMGPFAVSDMSGLDIAWAMRKRLAASRDPKARYVVIPDRLCEAGRFGRKAGRGWYDYSTGSARPDPLVSEIIEIARSEAGIQPRAYDTEAIQRQLMAAIVNEATCVIEEGVAQRPSDVDVVLANGYGFPRWRGGPINWAAREHPSRLEADLKALAAALGSGFAPGPVRAVLDAFSSDMKAA